MGKEERNLGLEDQLNALTRSWFEMDPKRMLAVLQQLHGRYSRKLENQKTEHKLCESSCTSRGSLGYNCPNPARYEICGDLVCGIHLKIHPLYSHYEAKSHSIEDEKVGTLFEAEAGR